MGCGASAKPRQPKDVTDEQRVKLCNDMGKQMMTLCVAKALARTDEIHVEAPKAISDLRTRAQSWRDQVKKEDKEPAEGEVAAANPAAEAEEAKADADEPAKDAKASGGGFFSGMIQKGAEMVSTAVDVCTDAVVDTTGKILISFADAVDKVVDKVEKPLSEVGKEIANTKKSEMEKVFKMRITNLQFEGECVGLVRGTAPYGPEQYGLVAGDSLCVHLFMKSDGNLASQLNTEVGEAIKAHASVVASKDAIDHYNSLLEKAKRAFEAFKLPMPDPISFDICDHIVEQTIAQLLVFAGDEEKSIRASPADKSVKSKKVFAKVFSGEALTDFDYEEHTAPAA